MLLLSIEDSDIRPAELKAILNSSSRDNHHMLWNCIHFCSILGDADPFLVASLFFAPAKMLLLYYSEYSAEWFLASYG